MEKSNVYCDEKEVKCCVCGKTLVNDIAGSMINIIQDSESQKIIAIKPCCKGKCDQAISSALGKNETTGWKEFRTFTNPHLYLKHIMSVINNMFEGQVFANEEAFEEYKSLVIAMYPYVTRNLSEEEVQTAIMENMIPF